MQQVKRGACGDWVLHAPVRLSSGAILSHAARMHGRLLILQHTNPQQLSEWARNLGAGWASVSAPGVRLLSRGAPLRESVDGRAIGARTGVLYNLEAQRAALAARGVPTDSLDGDGVCVAAVGAGGPSALGALARHGLLAVLHRGQGGVLVASDAQGIAPLYVLQPAEGGWMVASDRAGLAAAAGVTLPRDDARWQDVVGPQTGIVGLWRAPASVAVMVDARGITAMPWQASGEAAPYLRHRPAELTEGSPAEIQAAIAGVLTAAAAAWRLDHGALAAPSGPESACAGVAAGDPPPATPWPCLALSALDAEFVGHRSASPSPPWSAEQLAAAFAAAHAGSPFRVGALPEPEARLSESRRQARWLRYTWWRCGVIEAALDAAADADTAIALPHLAPAVIAALGALADHARPWPNLAPDAAN